MSVEPTSISIRVNDDMQLTLEGDGFLANASNDDILAGTIASLTIQFGSLRARITELSLDATDFDWQSPLHEALDWNVLHQDDVLIGGRQNDTIVAYGGDDAVYGGIGDDLLKGSFGDDLLRGAAGDDRLIGGDGQDDLRGGRGRDTLSGGSGNDYLYGGADADRLIGGIGEDTLDGGTGADTMIGGDHNDVYRVRDRGDRLVESATMESGGNDQALIEVDGYDARAQGVLNIEQFSLGDGVYSFSGSATGEWIIGNAGDNLLRGYQGNDTLMGGDGNDRIEGGSGVDHLDGGQDDGTGITLGDLLIGGGNNDSYTLDSPSDVVIERAGEGVDSLTISAVVYNMHDYVQNQTMRLFGLEYSEIEIVYLADPAQDYGGSRTSETITGNALANAIHGYGGNDVIYGYNGFDELHGGAGNDVLMGGDEDDWIVGGAGNDVLDGDRGYNELNGGAGADRFVLNDVDNEGMASISDFDPNEGDEILIDVDNELVEIVLSAALGRPVVVPGDGSSLLAGFLGTAEETTALQSMIDTVLRIDSDLQVNIASVSSPLWTSVLDDYADAGEQSFIDRIGGTSAGIATALLDQSLVLI